MGIGNHLKYKLEIANMATPVQKNFQQAKKTINVKEVREKWIKYEFVYAFIKA